MLRFILLTGLVLVSAPANSQELPVDYIFEAMLESLIHCEDDEDSQQRYFCGRFTALTDVLVHAGLCEKTDSSWVLGEPGKDGVLCAAQ